MLRPARHAAHMIDMKKWVCRSWPPHAWPHSVRTGYPHTPTQGNTTTLKRRQGAQHGLYGRIYILSSLWQDSHFRMFLPFAFTYLLAVAQMMYHAIVGARRNVTRLGPWLCLCLLLQGSSSSFRGVMVFRASSSQWLRLRRQRGGGARPPHLPRRRSSQSCCRTSLRNCRTYLRNWSRLNWSCRCWW